MKNPFHAILRPMLIASCIGMTTTNTQADNGLCSEDPAIACSTKSQTVLADRKQKVAEIYNGMIYPHPRTVLADHTSVNHLFEEGVVKPLLSISMPWLTPAKAG